MPEANPAQAETNRLRDLLPDLRRWAGHSEDFHIERVGRIPRWALVRGVELHVEQADRETIRLRKAKKEGAFE